MTKEEAIKELEHLHTLSFKTNDALKMGISALKGFEGITNGDVLQAVFPNMKVHEYTEKVVLNGLGDEFQIQSIAWKNWWNAPYKGVSE